MVKPVDILQRYWGYHAFRPLQEEIIYEILSGKEVIALLPTGGGKSICFQVPALMKEGLTLVISPLIALMNDQVDQLRRRGIKARCIHSGLHYKEIERILDEARFGDLKLLYISPERLQSSNFVLVLQRLALEYLVVDEAHCISMWGYDFRPAYLHIAEVRKWHPKVPVIALTATATEEVVQDIAQKLEMQEVVVYKAGFLRPNLKFGVLTVEDKRERCLQLVSKLHGAAVIYVRNRRLTRELAEVLQLRGISSTYYHAGLDADTRHQRESEFLGGKVRIMVATNAFGMGIDKSDVRMVIHYDLPDSLEAYYQEAGRGGRDGKDAYAIILFQEHDRIKLEQGFDREFPSLEEIKRVYRALANYLKLAVGSGEGSTFPFDFIKFINQYQLDAQETWSILKIIEQDGWIYLSDAFHQTARVRFRVNREVLYDYQIRHENHDAIIKILLRLYQGIMSDAVAIKEEYLADLLKKSKIEVRQLLRALHQEEIIEYTEPVDSPRITLMRERVLADNFNIDQKQFQFRKNAKRKGIDQILAYIVTSRCRQRFLLHYFNDTLEVDCGVCDNCRAAGRKKMKRADYLVLRKRIFEKLQLQEYPVSELLDSFKQTERTWVITVLQYLLNEEAVVKFNGVLRLKSEKS
ncbi:MAG: RecQ family ATP-dependent DNA helicase [Saprospiraceae bacterium]|nr:RecQ family ATP-dependent DNA helicase [Saprospiraceae bacterium]